jgi:hypothetical protein
MNFSFSKKKIIFSSIFIVLFIFLFSPLPAHAAWYDFLIGAVTFIPNVAIALIFYLLVVLTSLFSAFAGVILKWVISPTFISLSYTKPGFDITAGENPIIATGLGITQGFVNMILVLILIYIALSTILRLAGYETKKLLVTFVVVALLVNFSPVLCGLIVDASNIVMNYFLKELTGGQQLINSLKSIVDVVTANFNWEVFKVTKQIDIMMYFLVLAVFNWFLALALMLFAAVFLIRYIAIWILVILSPLAFACYILPATKKYWTLWWSQFLQWSFIGAIAGFFLYLGEQVASLAPSISSPPGEIGGAILPYLVPLAFLYIGLMVGFSTSAYGAKIIVDGFKKGTKAATKTAAGRGLQWTRDEYARMRKTYQAGISLGLPRPQAAGESIKRYWQRRVVPAIRPAAAGTTAMAAGKGIYSAVRDTAMAGARASFGIKRKGFKTCPTPSCRRRVSASATACPGCGHVF